MNIQNRFKAAAKVLNSTKQGGTLSGKDLARDFLVNGDKRMVGNFSYIRLSDNDMYRGYPYAAIDLRAKTVSRIAMADGVIVTSYKEGSLKKDQEGIHPYLKAIKETTNFDESLFWDKNSRYIDMKGVRYIAFVRGKTDNGVVGDPTEVYALNPYRITEVINQADGEIGGYIETQKYTSKQRVWEPHQIVRIIDDHPITEDAYGRIEPAKDAQFTLKQAGDYTRSSLNANENAPGIISSQIVLNPEQFANFKSSIRQQEKGKPIITNGGQVNWQSMNIDLDKSALDKINEIQRSELFAITGQSKTSMGIEESGTTRDTSEVQDNKVVRDQAIPTIQLFISALNLDYRKNYAKDYETYGWKIKVIDPTTKNIESDKASTELRDSQFDLANKLIAQGYDADKASEYAQGKISLEQLGDRTPIPVENRTSETTKETNTFNVSPIINMPETKLPSIVFPEIKIDNSCDGKHIVKDSIQKKSNQISARDYPEIYEDLDIDFSNLGCIMLDVLPIEVLKHVEDADSDLVEEAIVDYSVVPGEDVSHMTLLFGLLENGNEWADKVDKLLEDWEPGDIKIDEVGFFELPDSYAIIGHIKKTEAIIDGHERLTLLPHINTFSEYRPHVTLAYIKKEADVNKWVSSLDSIYKGYELTPSGINYGKKPDVSKNNYGIIINNRAIPYSFSRDQSNSKSLTNNQLLVADTQIIEQQQGALTNGIVNIDSRIVSAVINKVNNNQFENQSDIITKQQREEAERELEFLLTGFYTVLFGLYGRNFMQQRAGEIGELAEFKMNKAVTDYIKFSATEASQSHVNTVLNDLLETIQKAHNEATEAIYAELLASGEKKSKALYQKAKRMALEGEGKQTIISAIKAEQTDISTKRATTIARNETRRAFTMTQYEADSQFLSANGWLDTSEKRWITNSANPCQLCLDQAARGWIPFKENFVNKGDTLKYEFEKKDGSKSIRQVNMDYEDIRAGVLHVNCQCSYELRVNREEV